MPPSKSSFKKVLKSKSSKGAEQSETENDFLEAADAQEKGGGKWKAGDASKAVRFYSRALDIYDNGLRKLPSSFDLAYNKAHLTFALVQDPQIAPLLGSKREALNGALEAHRYALRLNEGNPDILFNTAQVLTSLADEVDDIADPNQKQNVVQLLREAVELFSACLNRQEMLLSELQASLNKADTLQNPGQTSSTDSMDVSAPSQDEEWAIIEQPITGSVVLDTATALIHCLEGLLAASVPLESSTLAAITEIATPLVQNKLPAYLALIPESVTDDEPVIAAIPTLSISSDSSATFTEARKTTRSRNPRFEARIESAMAVAAFQVGVAEAEYRSRLSTLGTFSSKIREAYEPILAERQIMTKTLSAGDITQQDLEVAVAFAEAYNNAVGPAQAEVEESMSTQRADIVLEGLVMAGELLSFTFATTEAAAMARSSVERAQILLLQGDLALRRYRVLSTGSQGAPNPSEALRGADKFYQSAASEVKRQPSGAPLKDGVVDFEELRTETAFKSLLSAAVMTMELQQFRINAERSLGVEKTKELLRDAVQDGLLDVGLAERLAAA